MPDEHSVIERACRMNDAAQRSACGSHEIKHPSDVALIRNVGTDDSDSGTKLLNFADLLFNFRTRWRTGGKKQPARSELCETAGDPAPESPRAPGNQIGC